MRGCNMIKSTVSQLYERCFGYYGDNIAIRQENRSYRYSDIERNGLNLAVGLQRLGMAKDNRVAFLMANCAEYIFCEYAVAKVGATRVPLAVLLGSEDHIYMMNLTACRVLVYHTDYSDRVAVMMPQLDSVEYFICVGDAEPAAEDHLRLQQLIVESDREFQPVAVDSEDIASIYFTGGTTGKPKGVMISHRAWACTYLAEMLEFDIDWQESFVFVTPLTHAAGCFILPVLLRNGCCVIVKQFDPETLLATIERERATATLLVPTMIYVLLEYAGLDNYDLSSLNNILYGASPTIPEKLKRAIERFGPIFTQFYGQTEAPMAMCALPRFAHTEQDPDRLHKILSSAGRPTLHTELRLLDDNGAEVCRGECGEIVVRLTNLMSGYYQNPEATAQTIRDGWLYTGDIAYQDETGLLYIVDRKKDMIISGGFNIYPREVEDVLHQHPAVSMTAVFGVPHDKWGEEVRAVVVINDGVEFSEQELINFVKARKGSMMAPKKILFVEAIPLTNLGKIDKKALRALYAN